MSLIISISGIRGIVGEDLTPHKVRHFASAFGIFCNSGKVVVGMDGRPSGRILKEAVCAGLVSQGCEVIYLGIVPTPTVIFSVKELSCAGGISITASHNPIEWNGLKLIGQGGMFLDKEKGAYFLEITRSVKKIEGQKKERVIKDREDLAFGHIDRVLHSSFVDAGIIKKRNFKVAVDCCNGGGSVLVPTLLERLGCSVRRISCTPQTPFPRGAEPVPENLTELSQMVKTKSCDIGFANDPDADRLAIVSEEGLPIGEDYTLTLAAMAVLEKKKGPVVANLSTSRIIDDVASLYGVRIYRTPVGEVNVAKRMREVNAIIGGEGNGGVILPQLHMGRDSMIGIALVLQLMTARNKTISELVKTLPRYFIVKDKIDRSMVKVKDPIQMLTKEYATLKIDRSDGIKIFFTNKRWLHLRVSNTEPIVRIIAEAETRKSAEGIVNEILSKLKG